MPPEILDLVIHHLDLGDSRNRRVLAALVATCKTLKQGAARCSIKVELQGIWSPEQLTGLCRAFPDLAGIGLPDASCCKLEELCHYQMIRVFDHEWTRVLSGRHLEAVLACRSLRHLDLRFTQSNGNELWGACDEGHHLPQGLAHLALPASTLPEWMEHEINGLTGLTRLDCLMTGFYPSKQAANLKWLAVGGVIPRTCIYRIRRDEFCQHVLNQLTNLTTLHLVPDEETLPMIRAPPSLQHLTVWGFIHTPALVTLLGSLPHLRSLELSKTYPSHWCASTNQVVTVPSVSTCLRELTIVGMSVDLSNVTPGGIRELHLQGNGKMLDRDTLAWLSRLTSIQKLDLSGWRSTAEMRVLGQLPIQEFVSDQGYSALAGMLGPNALQNLRIATLSARYPIWVTGRTPPPYGPDTSQGVANLLVGLPHFQLLQNGEKLPGSSAMAAALNIKMVVRWHPERWQCIRNDERVLIKAYRRV